MPVSVGRRELPNRGCDKLNVKSTPEREGVDQGGQLELLQAESRINNSHQETPRDHMWKGCNLHTEEYS